MTGYRSLPGSAVLVICEDCGSVIFFPLAGRHDKACPGKLVSASREKIG